MSVLVKGKDRCTSLVHPDDAARYGVEDGKLVTVVSEAGSVDVPAEITVDIKPGVVSLPHGWGHDKVGTRLSIARETRRREQQRSRAGTFVDEISGNAAVNGIPVSIHATN